MMNTYSLSDINEFQDIPLEEVLNLLKGTIISIPVQNSRVIIRNYEMNGEIGATIALRGRNQISGDYKVAIRYPTSIDSLIDSCLDVVPGFRG